MYTAPQTPSVQMPLLVQFTPLMQIGNAEEERYIYDEVSQTVLYTMAPPTTSSMKTWWTGKKRDSGYKKTD